MLVWVVAMLPRRGTAVKPNMNLDQRVGFRSSNATCFSQGETLRVACLRAGVQVGKPQGRSGSPTYRYHKYLTKPDITHLICTFT